MTSLSVEVADRSLAAEAHEPAGRLVADRAASALAEQDPTLWGPSARAEAQRRLAWVELPETARPLLAEIDALRADLAEAGIDRVVLAGMGGSSLAPEVICATAGVSLTVLDTTDPGQVADALAGDLEHTALVVSSKSGSTVETDSHRRIFTEAFAAEGLDPAAHLIAITDPGTSLEQTARDAGYRAVITAEPNLGGRYSALSAFGLVPAGLAGADVGGLLDDAAAVADQLAVDDAANPAVGLAAAFGAAHARGAEKLVLADTGSGNDGFADWAEQLVAESTGKQGSGLLPVVVDGPQAPGFADAGRDATTVALGPAVPDAAVAVTGSLGAQFLLWEHAVALAGRLLGINPFDQPDVEAAKVAARSRLGEQGDAAGAGAPGFVDGGVAAFTAGPLEIAEPTVSAAIDAVLDAVPAGGYLAVQAYLDRLADASAALLRAELARRSGVQVTFGWGPRFLHSTGQYHKGGHPNGAFLQLTGDLEADLDVPAAGFTLGGLQRAQALGDGQVLAEHGRPVLRLHLADRAAGLVQVMRAAQRAGQAVT